MIALVTAVFVASLVGSLHCAGMCGGIVTLCVSGRPVAQGPAWRPHLLYNGGRLVAYSALGAVSGALGAAVDLGGAAFGWSRVAMIGAGAVMIGVGLAALLRTFGVRIGAPATPGCVSGLFRRGLAGARALPPGWQPVAVGLLTGLLPCGWLYAFVISAAATGHAALGALTMAVFWTGTLPVMLTIGVGVQHLAAPLRRHIPRLTAIALLGVGMVTVAGRLQVPAYATAPVTPAGSPAEHVRAIDHANLPCCDDHP